MKTTAFFGMAAIWVATATPGRGVTLLSQNFDTSPVNYTNSPFVIDTIDPARYWTLSNAPGVAVNPGILGNATTYLAAQNMNNDGDGMSLLFDQNNPALINFDVNVTGYTDLMLSIDLAGLSMPEPENFVRASLDQDGDGFYELMLFNFAGGGNSPYVDATLGALTETFATFSNIAIPAPATPNGFLHLRLEIFNDTNTQTEASGVDNILISGVPEPGSVLLAALGGLSLLLRRSRRPA